MLYLEPVTILVHVFSLTMVQPAVVPVRRVTERFQTFVFVLFPGRVRHLRLQNFVRESPITNRKWLKSCRITIFYGRISRRLWKKDFRTQINGWQKWVSLIIIVFKSYPKKLVVFYSRSFSAKIWIIFCFMKKYYYGHLRSFCTSRTQLYRHDSEQSGPTKWCLELPVFSKWTSSKAL